MKNWDETLQEKLTSYQFGEEVSDAKVEDFFAQMDAEEQMITNKPFATIWRVAAAVTLLLVASVVAYRIAEKTTTTIKGQTSQLILPDGSTVSLNAQTTVSYNRINWLFDRSVEMEGEAFFEVEKGEKFTVNSRLGTTRVLGTSFNINTRNDEYEVKCFTGRVKVTSKDSSVELTAGKGFKAEYNQEIRGFEFDTQEQNWKKGEYHFKNESLKSVIDELSLSYDVKVELADSLMNLKYTGYFPVDNIDLALKLICEPMGMKYEKSDSQINIRPVEEKPNN